MNLLKAINFLHLRYWIISIQKSLQLKRRNIFFFFFQILLISVLDRIYNARHHSNLISSALLTWELQKIRCCKMLLAIQYCILQTQLKLHRLFWNSILSGIVILNIKLNVCSFMLAFLIKSIKTIFLGNMEYSYFSLFKI